MMTPFFIAFLLTIKNLFCSCHYERVNASFSQSAKIKIEKGKKLNGVINESSGLLFSDSTKSLITLNDSGGKNQLYQIDTLGNLKNTIQINHVTNKDWEEITKDTAGNMYIGDFGNNANNRKDLCIYKVAINHQVEKIEFRYEDQNSFPPSNREKNFDCEAFFWLKDSLFLIAKNRGGNKVNVYSIPDRKGIHIARVVQVLPLNGSVTGAAYDYQANLCAILSYGKIYLFKAYQYPKVYLKPYICQKFFNSNQSEGIAFADSNKLFITNEQGRLFKAFIRPKKEQ